MALVFISHASVDKIPYIRAIADELIDREHDLFVDRPGDMKYTAEEANQYFKFIPTGRDWRNAITKGLRDSDVVLACLSRRAVTVSEVLRQELSTAFIHEKLILVLLDDIPVTDLPAFDGLVDLARLQFRRIDGDVFIEARKLRSAGGTLTPDHIKVLREFDHLVADMLTLIEKKSDNVDLLPNIVAPKFDLLNALARIDRVAPSQKFASALSRIEIDRSPLAVILCGPTNEQVTSFVREYQLHNAPSRDQGFELIYAQWPALAASSPTDANRFPDRYRAAIAMGMNMSLASGKTQIVERLKLRRKITGFLSSISLTAVDRRFLGDVSAWLMFWTELKKEHPGLLVAPLLAVEFGFAYPGWQDHFKSPPERSTLSSIFDWRSRRRLRNDEFLSHVEALIQSGMTEDRIPCEIIHQFTPVTMHDAKQWAEMHEAPGTSKLASRVLDLFTRNSIALAMQSDPELAADNTAIRIIKRELKRGKNNGLSMEVFRRLVLATFRDGK